MLPVVTMRQMTWIAVPLALILSVASWSGTAAAGPGDRATGKECGTLVVQFPEGSGGAQDIKAEKIGCDAALEVVRSCVDIFDDDKAIQGWTVVTWTKTVMTNANQRVSYLPVGGGGCGELPKSCDDFGYKGVGFFNPKALGLNCRTARKKAKAWYDHSPPCGFGKTCDIGNYSCEGDPNTATVSCVRKENGYRFTWEMGE